MVVVYIDPQSYSNLAVYDYSLLSSMEGFRVIFCGNVLYDHKGLGGVDFRPIFRYATKRNPVFKLASYILSIFKAYKLIWKELPDVVHIQWLRWWPVDYLFLKCIKKRGAKVIFTAHNVLPHNSGNSKKKTYQKYYKQVDGVIVHARRSRDELISDFGVNDKKIAVIPIGTLDSPVREEDVEATCKDIKRTLRLEDKITFSILGKQSSYKGSDLVAKVWSKNKFLHESDQYQLLIVGGNDAVDFSGVQGLSNVHVVEKFVTPVEFQAFLRLTDVLLMPYRRISQSAVLLSAICEKIPFMVSDQGGLSEPLEFADVGWCIGEATVESLEAGLRDLCEHPSDIKTKKNNITGWATLSSMYDWRSIGRLTQNFYREVSGKTGADE